MDHKARRHVATEFAPDENEVGMSRPAHLEPHGTTPPLSTLTGLFEACLKKKLELRKSYLAQWMKVRFGVILTFTRESNHFMTTNPPQMILIPLPAMAR